MKLLILSFLVLVFANAGCSKVETRVIKFKNTEYRIPNSYFEAYISPDKGNHYARISPPNAPFTLVLAETDDFARNWQGGGAPLVTHINDSPGAKFESFEFPGGLTVCRKDALSKRCGLKVYDGDIGWAVIFDQSQLPNSTAIRANALKNIHGYREAANADSI